MTTVIQSPHLEPFEVTPQTLTVRERQLRDKFVMEYMVDHNYTKAATRTGWPNGQAQEMGTIFMYDPYTQKAIANAMSAADHCPEVELSEQQKIKNLLFKEATSYGLGSSQSGRVAALSKLSSIHGMDKPTQTESLITNQGSVDLNLKQSFDFETMDEKSIELMRKLLVIQVENGN